MENPAFLLRKLILVTGPSRSGKSEWAEWLAQQSGRSIVYIATATIDTRDQEWQARILRHQQRRPANWRSIEVPIELAATIRTINTTIAVGSDASACLLIDSLGTWLANLLEQEESLWQQTVQDFLASLQTATYPIILVAEETGWGVVPAHPLGRQFRDRLGNLTRQVGAIADAVYLVTGGYALDLTQIGVRLPALETSETEEIVPEVKQDGG